MSSAPFTMQALLNVSTTPFLNVSNGTFTTVASASNKTNIIKDDVLAEELQYNTMAFFILLVMLGLCVIVVSFLLNKKLHFIPEALAVMILGLVLSAIIVYVLGNIGVNIDQFKNIQSFHPDIFFLILLPPIIFESGYTLQKGDFFSNIGAILTYALLGTTVSALIIGFAMYGVAKLGLATQIGLLESLSFGSLISATDPVSTLALFSAMNADQDLYAIVFGESVLNDAVSIILTQTLMNAGQQMDNAEGGSIVISSLLLHSLGRFCMMFFLSALIGVAFGLVCALILKHINLRDHPSLECVIMFIFAYMPYGLSEGLELSGIMAILLCGITMSHYAHFNLSPLGQIAVQQIFRLLALVSETFVFLFLGTSMINGTNKFDVKFTSWALLFCLIARAVVVFPLSLFFIYCRSKENRVSNKVLFLVWFSGLRGAVAYAQSLHLPLANTETRGLIISTTLAIIIFTNVVLGGATLPLVKLLKVQSKRPKAGISKSLGMFLRFFEKNTKEKEHIDFMKTTVKLGLSIGVDPFPAGTSWSNDVVTTPLGYKAVATSFDHDGRVIGPSEASSQAIKYKARRGKSPMSIIRGWRRFDKKYLMPFFIKTASGKAKEYQAAVTHMIDRWAENEERVAHQFLTSSAELEEHTPIIVNRTRKNIVRPVRRYLRTVDDGGRTEDESDTNTPAHIAGRVRFASIDEISALKGGAASEYGSIDNTPEKDENKMNDDRETLL